MAAFDILVFLQHYHQHPCLWDKSLLHYKIREKRDYAESVLLEISGLESIKALRAKIRSIRGTYNNELRKIKKSITTGSDVYKPKLHWFDYANSFLNKNYEDEPESESNLTNENDTQEDDNEEVTNRKRSAENMTMALSTPIYSKRSITQEGSDSRIATVSTEVGEVLSKSGPESRPLKNYRTNEILKDTVANLKVVSDNFASDDYEFMVFGQSVGIQLSKLPLHKALVVQHDIQSLLTRARLAELITSSATLTTPSPTASLSTFTSLSPSESSSTFITPHAGSSPFAESFQSSSLSFIRNTAGIYGETQEEEEKLHCGIDGREFGALKSEE